MNGTYTATPEDTTGLGEYSDSQLLNELFKRGVISKIIGEMEYRETSDPSLNSWTDEDKEAFARNRVRGSIWKNVYKAMDRGESSECS